jgi:predicted transcriptional regulator
MSAGATTKTVIGVESFEEMKARKSARAARLTRGKRIKPERRISFESSLDLLACITPERIRLIEAARRSPQSVSDLAKSLRRHRAAVHRDVKALADHGMVTVQRQKNPGHGQVQIVAATAARFMVSAKF